MICALPPKRVGVVWLVHTYSALWYYIFEFMANSGLNVPQEWSNGEADCTVCTGIRERYSLVRKQRVSFLLPMAGSCGEPTPVA
jgi:hypothetical protein